MSNKKILGVVFVAVMALSGCKTNNGITGGDKDKATTEEAKSAADSKKFTADSKKPVADSSKVVAGEGRKVKGIDGWEGEITGTPAKGSKFNRLKIGMSIKQVVDLIGAPTDQGAYMTGKAWIPFYYGSDKHRFEYVYKKQGRLIFAVDAAFRYGATGHLVWIIHNANELGSR